uniref:Uncharacterized protein n=1 Tax=Panagrolaimus sp. PS1159 TaxID=55785 RepID=A0AC35G5Z0_9BILA
MFLARSASSLWESRHFVHQRLRTVDFGSDESISTLVRTPNPNFENAKNSVRKCFNRERERSPLSHLLILFFGFWIFAALLLLTVESGSTNNLENDKSEEEKKIKAAQERLLKHFWKMNRLIKIDSTKWNETVLSLLHWFEFQQNEPKIPVFDSLFSSWNAFMFISAGVGGIPGYPPIKLSENGRILIIITCIFSIIIYYFAIWSFAKLFNSISKSNQIAIGVITVIILLVKVWLQALSYNFLQLPGNWFQWISVMSNFRAFSFPSASLLSSTFYLFNHIFLWTLAFIFIQKFKIWRSNIYLQIVCNLDSETALLVMLPDLKLDRAEHLIQKYSQNSILCKFKASLLKEKDKLKILEFIEEYQERNREEISYF